MGMESYDQEVITLLSDFEALWEELYPAQQTRIIGAYAWMESIEITPRPPRGRSGDGPKLLIEADH